MCLFRKCDETIIETKEYPSMMEKAGALGWKITAGLISEDFVKQRVTTIKCAACGRIRIDQRSV